MGSDHSYGNITSPLSAGNGTDTVAVSTNVSGLSENTLYHYRLVGTNSAGNSYGPDMSFTISNFIPLVITGGATNVTQSAATLNGTIFPNGLSTTYYFEWGMTTAYGNTASSQFAGSGTGSVAVSANISGLTKDAAYHYHLVAANSAGTGYGSDRVIQKSYALPWLMLLLGD